MQWTSEAEAAIQKAPFFVRKRIRSRVEKETAEAGRGVVTIEDVNAVQAQYLTGMESKIKGYQIDACFGANGCPNRVVKSEMLFQQLERVLKDADLLVFLKRQVKGPLKFHHEFRVTLADCPNACSQPQIKDFAVIGALSPHLTEEICISCGPCVEVCDENAISIGNDCVHIDKAACMMCGHCVTACTTGKISSGDQGWRILIGGKLGRRPRLAREIAGIHHEDEVAAVLNVCISWYKKNSIAGRRFGHLLQISEEQGFVPDFWPQ